jgi:hypothetical protein
MPSVLVYVNKYSVTRERREINKHEKMALSCHVFCPVCPTSALGQDSSHFSIHEALFISQKVYIYKIQKTVQSSFAS